MKIKNIFAILLALTLLTCTFVIPTSAKKVYAYQACIRCYYESYTLINTQYINC